MYKLFSTLIIIIFFSVKIASGETRPDTTKKDTTKEKSSLKIGADYISNNVFVGRAPKVAAPIISPNLKYAFSWGIYISATADYLPNNKTNKLDGGDFSAGYDFDITDDLSGGVSYTKLFYNTNSTQIGSSITSDINVNLDYDIGEIITPSVSFDYDINKQGINPDVLLNFGLSHDLIFEKLFTQKDFILISPTIAMNTGTQNFYDAYLTKKVLKNAKRTAAQNATISKFEQGVIQFKLLDYELSVPVEYKSGPFIFHFTPEYDIVENGFKSATVAKALGISNEASVFYFTVGVALKF